MKEGQLIVAARLILPEQLHAPPSPAFVATHYYSQELCFAITSTRTHAYTEEREPLQSTKGHIPFLRLIHHHSLSLSFRSAHLPSLRSPLHRTCVHTQKEEIYITLRSKDDCSHVRSNRRADMCQLVKTFFSVVSMNEKEKRERERETSPQLRERQE